MPGYEVIGNEELAQIREIFDSGGILFRHGFDEQGRGCYKVKDVVELISKKEEVSKKIIYNLCLKHKK